MAEGARLESVLTGNRYVGSNPTLSVLRVYASVRLAVWTGGRVVEGAGLENRYARKGIEGSNPSLSVSP